ncbi:hypothetical protein BU24DRAFT_349327 [Aaosphaeria arxii CBS 175.79]|uniref:Cell wall proline rich protein n=1 Tax=Aaosphaeria arxii CBS 175.79 TaxID=1450172 RepID=A0A6A5XP31_9PLEO|nr:uncharacterized protein BU24DRAFT_349327 [Aaosphaeria arxii CBS 175.79]KAF2014902.1 hypothetical protein BU24DRAFT_349327 [Aaosphaeria arxii CBS 175.79]
MAQIALPRQQVTHAQESTDSGIGSPLYERRRASNAGPVELIPNPDFSFPQMPADESSNPSARPNFAPKPRPMSLQAFPTGRRGSAQAARQKSVSALPDFSFNPAGPSKQPATTPPHSPIALPTTPSRPIGGHRRGGSEFIGGDGRAGSTNLLSSSPTKGEAVLPPPSNTLRPGPPAGRRGHAHRRSGAVSSHDLSSIMQPASAVPPPARAGSAPVTPLEGDQFVFGHAVNKSISQPSLRDSSFFDDANSSGRRPSSRQRVGFSDKVEIIRPLSTISSETETSMSTIRGHSATGSLSSVISAGTSSPASARTRPSLNTTLESDERPSTAGAVLDMYKSKNVQFDDDVFNRKRPMSAVSPASLNSSAGPVSPRITTKRRGFFRLESRRSDPSIHTLSTSISDPALSASVEASALPSPMLEDEENVDETDKAKSSRKGSLKPRKVKSWANSIIRKGKHGNKIKDRPPTPPPAATDANDSTEEMDFEATFEANFEANFDVDNTVTIVTPTENAVPEPKLNTDIASWKPRELKRADSDAMSPVIDLDAALGPFNTPQGTGPRGQQRGFGAHRRAMHSASGYTASHRRTESAPELAPFDARASAVASPTTMADVFEEDEPEEEPSQGQETKAASTDVNDIEEEVEEPKIQLVEAAESQNGTTTTTTIKWNFNDGLGIQRRGRSPKGEDSEPLSPLQAPQPVPSGNGSKQSLTTDPIETKESQQVMNLSLPLPQQSLRTPDTFTSSFSSPDFRSSQASLDIPRLGTAASSMTDYRAMPSPQFGEPGPELRVSVDDVPSLTSSRSTMTSGMHNVYPLMSPRRPGERSTSLCSVSNSETDSRRQKRSSIASLSRLINSSSFGEKSKLSIEQRPHSEYLEPARESKKKHKRLSKLMQFWKQKDSSRT